jgi:hypothetical protein
MVEAHTGTPQINYRRRPKKHHVLTMPRDQVRHGASTPIGVPHGDLPKRV